MRTSFIVPWVLGTAALVVGVTAPGRAAAVTPRAFRERVEAAAGTNVGLLVLTSTGVKVLDAAGGLLPWQGPVGEVARQRWSSTAVAASGKAPPPAPPAPPLWPGLTRDADFGGATYDPDDIDDPDDPRLADEVTARPWDIDDAPAGTRSTQPTAGVPPPRPLVAAAGDAGWVVRRDGVWKVGLRDGTATRAYACDGHRIRALAAGGAGAETTVALVDGEQILRARDGRAFERIGGPVPRVRALAIDTEATVVVLDGDGRLRRYSGTADGGTIVFGAGVDDLVTCPREALVLREAELFALTEAGIHRIGPVPEGTEGVACGDQTGGWAAFGTAVHVSADRGRTWTLRPSSTIRPIRAMVPTATALWIAVPQGLWPLPPVQQVGEPDGEGRRLAPAPRQTAWEGRGRPSDFWRRWSALLPEVDVDFEIGRVGPVRELRGMVAASFRVDGLWSGLVRLRGRAGRVSEVRADVGSTQELDALAVGAGDPLATAERRALARILEEPAP